MIIPSYLQDNLNVEDLKPSPSVALVKILVMDENDNVPKFQQTHYYAGKLFIPGFLLLSVRMHFFLGPNKPYGFED